jgi:UDP-N-acetylglucosamine acyltransferase
MSVRIDPTALVSPKAELGNDVSVGPYTIIEDDVRIGDGTQLASHILIAPGARIGKECRIHHGAVISTIPQDLKFAGEYSELEIGDRTVVREFATLNRGTKDRHKTTIGANCLVMAYAHVAHDCIIGDGVILANAVNMGGHVTIEDYAIIGGMVPIHQFVRIGRHVMIGGGFRVTKDVPPYILAGHEPLSYVGVNVVGLRRRRFSAETISNIEMAYRMLYDPKLNISSAIEKIKNEMAMTEEVKQIVKFVEGSDRGLIGARRTSAS